MSGFANKYYYKAEVELACNQGFSLEGSRTIVCGANGTWEPAIPKCVPGTKHVFYVLLYLDFNSLTLSINDTTVLVFDYVLIYKIHKEFFGYFVYFL